MVLVIILKIWFHFVNKDLQLKQGCKGDVIIRTKQHTSYAHLGTLFEQMDEKGD